jgi:hypothetical protein
VSARTIGHEVQVQVIAHEQRIFVVRAALPDMCRAAGLEHELCPHSTFHGVSQDRAKPAKRRAPDAG